MSRQAFVLTVDDFLSAICNKSVDDVRYALEHRPELLIATISRCRGQGPAHVAAELGSLDVLRLLVDYGIDLLRRDSLDRIALHYGAYGGEKVVEYLLEKGSPVDTRDKYGNTPLHIAAKAKRFKSIELLLGAGALVDARDQSLNTPLMKAALSGCVRAAKLLLDAGADINITDRRGLATIHSVGGRRPRMTKLLITEGASLGVGTFKGESRLIFVEMAQQGIL